MTRNKTKQKLHFIDGVRFIRLVNDKVCDNIVCLCFSGTICSKRDKKCKQVKLYWEAENDKRGI